MLRDKHFASELMLISTASVTKNTGFSTAKSSSLHFLNGLLINFVEHLAKKLKKLVEAKNVTETSPEDIFAILHEMNFSISELSVYVNSVASFPLTIVPIFPVKHYKAKQSDTNLANNTTTAFDASERIVDTRQNFPTYAGKSWRELNFSQCIADSEMDGSLDSLSSPILHLRRIPSRKFSKDFYRKNSASELKLKKTDNERAFKSVLSEKGLTLRLLNSNADTPPGFFSSRTKIRKGEK